jgi:SagB-type dehydrogenase family enzyme
VQIDRSILKSDRWEEWHNSETDQKRGIPRPPAQQPYPDDAVLVDLVAPADLQVGRAPLIDVIARRRSRRNYTEESFTLEELSFLLWATQGLSGSSPGDDANPLFRTVPSGGARHPFETYLLVHRVEGLEFGLYRYLPLLHKLYLVSADQDLTDRVHEACYNSMAKDSAVTFIWTAVPRRSEWRYSALATKLVAQDSGHLCQNLYLACEAIGAGTCAIGAYDQHRMDPIPGVDGEEEFTVYVAPAGKVPAAD